MDASEYRLDYGLWHHLQVASGDIDPMYPVLKRVADYRALTADERAWSVFLHVAWYHPGSTFAAMGMWPLPDGTMPNEVSTFPCGTERRGHRSLPRLIKHLNSLRTTFAQMEKSSVDAWVRLHVLEGEPFLSWHNLTNALLGIDGNGRWAAYKTVEMLQKVCGYELAAPDAGHAYSSGPRHGLKLLYPDAPDGNSAADISRLDAMTSALAYRLGEDDIAQVETTLCDFDSMVKGRYYTGHDIDAMQAALLDERVRQHIHEDVWEARRESFSAEYLGEIGGWVGVRKELNTRYKSEGRLL